MLKAGFLPFKTLQQKWSLNREKSHGTLAMAWQRQPCQSQRAVVLPGHVAARVGPAPRLQMQICRPSAAACISLHTWWRSHVVIWSVLCTMLHAGSSKPSVQVRGGASKSRKMTDKKTPEESTERSNLRTIVVRTYHQVHLCVHGPSVRAQHRLRASAKASLHALVLHKIIL